ncbi:hypothetical protein KJI95_14345 [Shewanella sp. JM162201]|uniref:Integron Cassette Protein Hfx-Cass5 domain-containing protein n=1 Tax=Shewanella jiangmenensis TaxID=2837387 RepID=A0ABS5V786_9GAMM|nr:hypothetical protein [Shewanella jiangmenensis]MBT1445691.1 hypothetical protein [Shewanella jiangmenensis]
MEDRIEEIGIDEEERLYVKPSNATFPMIYREAMEVHWNSERCYLYGAKPRKWGYLEWFQQIIRAASEQGCKLKVTQSVSWVNVPGELQKQIIGAHCANNT